jgi:hypothetical protein
MAICAFDAPAPAQIPAPVDEGSTGPGSLSHVGWESDPGYAGRLAVPPHVG